ncbi:beta family protein [Marinomonas communis]|uniref:T4 beta protein n=1 Tax=Marinomonas communis TaxID=28254 RepID=A0A4R6X0Y5_9GAMM|nr:beta family protein [Marinomonas communis]TDR12466.1 T4 beta protein [Marinomonas communis]
MSDFVYFPLIKTRDAELRCFDNIHPEDFDNILPIYELTKSRVTSKAPDGDIYRRMERIKNIQKDRPFILDLSTDERYMNPQIQQLLSESHGFREWQYFILDLHSSLNIIPVIHIHEDNEGFSDVEEFVKIASSKKEYLAVRLPYDLSEDIDYYLSPIMKNLQDGCKLYVLLDAGYIRNIDKAKVSEQFLETCESINNAAKIKEVVMLCTSFPSSVAQEGGHDSDGSFDIYEEEIFNDVRRKFPIKYGDYVSINTEQIEMKGGTFVPRIDVASLDGNTFTYKRFRRDHGGYVKCAKQTILDTSSYTPLNTWADKEIELASQNDPTGISPAFWISVRMNYYLKTRLNLRLKPTL